VYVSVQSIEELAEGAGAVTRRLAAATAVAIALGSLLCIGLVTRISKPVRALLRDMRGTDRFGGVEDSNELEFIAAAFSQAKERERELRAILDESERDQAALLARDLLSGDPERLGDAGALEKQFPHPVFVVAVIAVDRYGAYRAATSAEFRAYSRLMLLSRLQDSLPEGWRMLGCAGGPGQTALILNMQAFAQEGQDRLAAFLDGARAAAREVLGHTAAAAWLSLPPRRGAPCSGGSRRAATA